MGFSYDSAEYEEIEEAGAEAELEDAALDADSSEVLDAEENEGEVAEETMTPDATVEDESEESDEDYVSTFVDGKLMHLPRSEYNRRIKGEISDPDLESLKTYKPIIDIVRDDDVLKEYIRYKSLGEHRPEDIIDGMFLKRHPELYPVIQNYYANGGQSQPQEQEEPPVFESLEEEVQYYARKAAQEAIKSVLPHVQQVQQKQQQYEQIKQLEYIDNHNNTVMEAALVEYGYDPTAMTPQELKSIAETLKILYPGVDFRRTMIGEAQAKTIIKTALGKKEKAKPATRDYVKQSSLPSVKPVGASRRSLDSKKEKIDGASKAERLERIREFFG